MGVRGFIVAQLLSWYIKGFGGGAGEFPMLASPLFLPAGVIHNGIVVKGG
jgi:hypothetical protein